MSKEHCALTPTLRRRSRHKNLSGVISMNLLWWTMGVYEARRFKWCGQARIRRKTCRPRYFQKWQEINFIRFSTELRDNPFRLTNPLICEAFSLIGTYVYRYGIARPSPSVRKASEPSLRIVNATKCPLPDIITENYWFLYGTCLPAFRKRQPNSLCWLKTVAWSIGKVPDKCDKTCG